MAWKCNFVLNLKNPQEAFNGVRRAVVGRLVEGCQDVVADAKRLSPKRTGHNRRSIDYKMVVGTQINASVVTSSGYGGYLEVGTRKKAARPYIIPAYMKHKSKIKDSLRGCV